MRNRLLVGALITLIGFPILGWGILSFFREHALSLMFSSDYSMLSQVPVGAVLGIMLGLGAKSLLSLPFLNPTLKKYSRLIGQLNLSELDLIFISFCAGFGEEILFRGSLQLLLGIWITAIVFVAIHGYLNPKNLKLSIYGVYMSIAIAIIGYASQYFGLITACVAHMVIDIILFRHLIKTFRIIST